MNKPYLLIAYYHCYPYGGTGDWKGTYATEDEARAQVLAHKNGSRIVTYSIASEPYKGNYDHFEIVDLREWTNG